MTADTTTLAQLKIDLLALLQSAGKFGLSVDELCRDYEDATYNTINPEEFGYPKLSKTEENYHFKLNNFLFDLFMTKCRDCMRFNSITKKFQPKVTAETRKLQSMINRTRTRTNRGKKVGRIGDSNVTNKNDRTRRMTREAKARRYTSTYRNTNLNDQKSAFFYTAGKTPLYRQPTKIVTAPFSKASDANKITRFNPYNTKSSYNRSQTSVQTVNYSSQKPVNSYRNTQIYPKNANSGYTNSDNHAYTVNSKKPYTKVTSSILKPRYNPFAKEFVPITQGPSTVEILRQDQSSNKQILSAQQPRKQILSEQQTNNQTQSVQPVPQKMKQIYANTIRDYQMTNKKFYLKDIDTITKTITNGSKSACDFKRYGFSSVLNLFKSFDFCSFEYQAASNEFIKFKESNENTKLFVNFLKDFKKVSLTEIRDKAKQQNVSLYMRQKLKEMHFTNLKEYIVWLSFSNPEIYKFNKQTEMLEITKSPQQITTQPQPDALAMLSEDKSKHITQKMSGLNISKMKSSSSTESGFYSPEKKPKIFEFFETDIPNFKTTDLSDTQFLLCPKDKENVFTGIALTSKYQKLVHELEKIYISHVMSGLAGFKGAVSKSDGLRAADNTDEYIIVLYDSSMYRAQRNNLGITFIDERIDLEKIPKNSIDEKNFFKIPNEFKQIPRHCIEITFTEDPDPISVLKPYKLVNLRGLNENEYTADGVKSVVV